MIADHFDAVIFDKDGTLLDFAATWNRAVVAILEDLIPDPTERSLGAAAIGFDLDAGTILPGSSLVYETNAETAARLSDWIPGIDDPDFMAHYDTLVVKHGVSRATALPHATETMTALRDAGIAIGIATNDAERVARATVDQLGWTELVDAIVGYDSGYGAKPEPGMVTGCIELLGASAARTAMVGDSAHDVVAARAAGATAVLIGGAPVDPDDYDHHIAGLAELTDVLSRGAAG